MSNYPCDGPDSYCPYNAEGGYDCRNFCGLGVDENEPDDEDYDEQHQKGIKQMKNYICINGNKTELTEEQLKQLGIELPKANPFERVELNAPFFRLGYDGCVYVEYERKGALTNDMFNVANYCTDKSLMEQRALHETLNRLLWRYSMEHDGDKIDWDGTKCKYKICYNHNTKEFGLDKNLFVCDCCSVYFITEEIANEAIDKVAIPFMTAHPDFKF